MPQEDLSIQGQVHIYLHGPDGKLKDERFVSNVVTSNGKVWLSSYLAGQTTSNMVEMAIGTSSVAVTAADSLLGNEVSNPRVVGTLTSSNNMWQNTATFGQNNPSSTNTTPITEGGIFNHFTNNTGSMYTHATWAAVNKAPADTLTVVWQVTNS